MFYNDIPANYKSGTVPGDSFDICTTSNFLAVFNSINNAIRPDLLQHLYGYWPIVITNNASYFSTNDVDPAKITVKKVLANGPEVLISPSAGDGFEYIGFQTNFNIREKVGGVANPGEPYTGFFLKLNGNAKALYPEYIKITTTTKTHYYGYVKLDYKPVISSIKLVINGKDIPQSDTNGWSYLGDDYATKNIRITSPTNTTEDYPAVSKTGWFLKVSGSAVYSNSADVNVYYLPRN